MKKKRLLIMGSLVLLFMCLAVVLTSCNFVKALMGKDSSGTEPKLLSAIMLKLDENYLESNEYLYNKDSGNPMALKSGESFLIQLTYDNPDKYAISYVKLNGNKIMPKAFENGSSATKTIIKVTAEESQSTVEAEYKVNSVYYNTGSATKVLKVDDGIDTDFKAIIAPTYKLTIDYENADRRSTSANAVDTITTSNGVAYGDSLNVYNVLSKDYSLTTGLPVKEGGWVFDGFYTQPNGKGFLVTDKDTYYFWEDTTLYANYIRLFQYTLVDLDTPIEHSYKGYVDNGGQNQEVSGVKTFYQGAVLTGSTGTGHPKLDVCDTIVEETTHLSTDGSTVITAVEFPIVKVGNNAFKDVNTITELKIGKYVEEIAYSAFSNANKISKLTFSDDSRLKYIGDYAFQNTKAMGVTVAVTLPMTVTYIGNCAFRYSGWGLTNNDGRNESVLHIRNTFRFIGASAFFKTNFNKVIFDAGCQFESQITYAVAKANEDSGGWSAVRPAENQIGANLFASCANLTSVEFLADNDNGLKSLNIIPDNAFDAQRYTVSGLKTVSFAEGLTYIGNSAFSYQTALTSLVLPSSLEEIDIQAFYNTSSVSTLTFGENSQLKIMHTECFAKNSSLDRVEITSAVFSQYGNGPFSGCSRLKSIEFPNINSVDKVPLGFYENDPVNGKEVIQFHEYCDFMYGTFESGNKALDETNVQSTYSLPTRVFCKEGVVSKFKENLKLGKGMYTIINDTRVDNSPKNYENTIFVYDIGLVMKYTNPADKKEVTVALQTIYDWTSGAATGNYSLAFWADRSSAIEITSEINGYRITEISMYAVPTSVQSIKLAASITKLEHDAFNNCTNLSDVTFEDINTLAYVGDFAFMGTKLRYFEGGTALKVIGQYAFYKCKSIAWVDLSASPIKNVPDIGGVKSRVMPKTTYKYDYELTDDNKNDWTDYLGGSAFAGCTSLKWIYLPKKLKQLCTGLLSGCVALNTVILDIEIGGSDPIYTSTSISADEVFYEKATPTGVYDTATIMNPLCTVYVREIATHQGLFPQANYKLIIPNDAILNHPAY